MGTYPPWLAVAIAAALALAYYIGYRNGKPDPVKMADENYRNRFNNWLQNLWGLEEAMKNLEPPPIPVGLQAVSVYVDPDSTILPWVLHTNNLSLLRVQEAETLARKRGAKFGAREEKGFQHLLKQGIFLKAFTTAVLNSDSLNYDDLRPALLAIAQRYPPPTKQALALDPKAGYSPAIPASFNSIPDVDSREAKAWQCASCRKVFLVGPKYNPASPLRSEEDLALIEATSGADAITSHRCVVHTVSLGEVELSTDPSFRRGVAIR